jgi:hypothetical protein
MADNKESLESRIKDMPLEELISFEIVTKNVNRLVNVFGVSMIFLMIIYTNIITLLFGIVIVYVSSHISVGITNSLVTIRQQIEKCKS